MSLPSGLGYLPGPSQPDDVTPAQIKCELNSDFEASLLSAAEMQALVAAWQQGAISRDTLRHNFRTGEILPPALTNEQELELIRKEPAPLLVVLPQKGADLTRA